MDTLTQRLEQLEGKVNVLSEENSESKKRISVLEQKLTKSKTRISKLENKLEKVKRLNIEVSDLKKNVKEQQKQVQDTSNKCEKYDKLQIILSNMILKGKEMNQREMLVELKSKLESLCLKVEEVEAQINDTSSQGANSMDGDSTIKSYQDKMAKTAFYIHFVRGTKLVSQVHKYSLQFSDPWGKTAFNVYLVQGTKSISIDRTQLDCCDHLIMGRHCFDEETGLFTSPKDGIYLFSITVYQTTHGRLRFSVGDAKGQTFSVATTYIKADSTGITCDDSRSGSVIVHLTQGQQVGVYVCRLEGRAKVAWCRFSGCLLST